MPDITNNQVQINAVASSLSPFEVEKQVTFTMENALAGIPAEESVQVRQWYYDIGAAVAAASKGIKASEQEYLDRLKATLDL